MGANNRFCEWSRGIIDTAGFEPAVSLTLRDLIPQCNWHRGIESCGVNDTAESDPLMDTVGSDPAVSLTSFSNDYLNFLGEYEPICETALASESWP
jgi:hypothetical protein